MYTMMGCCKLAGVNVEAWLTYFLDHVHEYDIDHSLDIADFLPSSLVSKGLLKTSKSLRKSSFGESPKILGETSKSPKYLNVVHRMLTNQQIYKYSHYSSL